MEKDLEGRIEHEKLGKDTVQVIKGRKVVMPRQPASKGFHRLCDVFKRHNHTEQKNTL